MPRTYIKKKIASYTQEDMAKAIQAVVKGEMSMYAAAKIFRIPTTTLFGRIKENSRAPKVGRPLAKEAVIFENIRRLEEIDKTVQLQKTSNEKSKIPKKIMNTKEEECFNEENNNKVNSVIQKNKVIETFGLGKTIIVKYYIKKKWKYYVGVITEINDNQLDKRYGTSFYKSKWRNNSLIFMKPKKADTDCIPDDLIVKEMELIQIRENPDEFVLKDMKDNVYF